MKSMWPNSVAIFYYRLQRSWAKVIFSQVCVKNSVHGEEGVCLSACWDTPPDQTPLDQAPPRPGTSPRPGTPRPGTPQDRTPPQEADCSIRSTSGQYASYWNAFLYDLFFTGPGGPWPPWICYCPWTSDLGTLLVVITGDLLKCVF